MVEIILPEHRVNTPPLAQFLTERCTSLNSLITGFSGPLATFKNAQIVSSGGHHLYQKRSILRCFNIILCEKVINVQADLMPEMDLSLICFGARKPACITDLAGISFFCARLVYMVHERIHICMKRRQILSSL